MTKTPVGETEQGTRKYSPFNNMLPRPCYKMEIKAKRKLSTTNFEIETCNIESPNKVHRAGSQLKSESGYDPDRATMPVNDTLQVDDTCTKQTDNKITEQPKSLSSLKRSRRTKHVL